ncbi:class I SAM-dependent DNA methyltransferase [Terricaulis silvestris]|uniref:site-specific DNA-methyltransferase (adenine-specific) n=1 Tax=Terricaulis silvestris TaxID=2686094 RepID=A0A6I6MTD5_9CAUL|nr:N-6 DNA methylase [Terricaulis silvestris]QGZ96628.1 putative type I restriction enzymeP M protein [Terricaulis silvestris]
MDDIGEIEKRLWSSADNLRANSNFASNEYFLPVMGLIFLRHAYSRFLKVRAEIEPALPKRAGQTRALTKEDFSGRGAIYLQPTAQFDHLAALPDSADRAKAIIAAMESIEGDYDSLAGTLPKSEYTELDNDVLGNLLRVFNDPALQKANGDVFGRIYEYFLTQFADLKAHDGGEFFTPVSLVQLIVNVIEPEHGKVLDPACGSGGMFVQSAHFIESLKKDPTKSVTFYGMEKNPTTIRLAKMNLAVHGLEGRISKAISYYEDSHELVGKADFVMANPPFNVDEIDADKIRRDPRLPYGLPGVNNKGKVSNGNYVWISYFDAYLSGKGRAGFVMSSQASSASGQEATVRRDLIKSGHVDAMVSIRGNFFYTRSVPCELWFLNKDRPKAHADKILMLDARGVYRKVTRRIFDFSPEQLANLTAIVWLYRGQSDRFLALVTNHLQTATEAGRAALEPLDNFLKSLAGVEKTIASVGNGKKPAALTEIASLAKKLRKEAGDFRDATTAVESNWAKAKRDNKTLHVSAESIATYAERGHVLAKDIDHVTKMLSRLTDSAEPNGKGTRDAKQVIKALEEMRGLAADALNRVRHFARHAHWLQLRFPEAKLRDVDGLVKLVDFKILDANDWSLSPGRYVGVAPQEIDEDFDFDETMREIHSELEELNAESVELASQIASNLELLL